MSARTPSLVVALAFATLLACGCATTLHDAERLQQAGQSEQAYALIEEAARKDPSDRSLKAALQRQSELTVHMLILRTEAFRSSGRIAAARAALARAETIDAGHARLAPLRAALDRDERDAALVAAGEEALARGRLEEAEASTREVLAATPGQPAARDLARRIAAARPTPLAPATLGPAFQKPVTLEFREAPLRQVFEALSRGVGVNFVFDKDVRGDARISLMLRDVSLDEAMRVILATQQLERKLLNESTVLIYPNNQAKQREHQELATRSFYLVNTDVKQAQNLVRTVAKTRDLFVDERLNMMVVRETPEVLRLIESLIASIDLPEPEVLLEVEVMEIASNTLDALGLQWPEQIRYGLPDVPSGQQVRLSARGDFRGTTANPALIATLRSTSGVTNTLANPRLRARNREKARIHVGERLPVFTTTSTANVGVSASVSYLDIGLKLDVEPSVQLDNEVVIKVGLEVSNLVREVQGPQGSIAYEIGTRVAATSLRLRDGETQVLAGLINDEDRKSVSGLPGVSRLPVVGRLFGVHGDSRAKSEVVLLITPRVIRNVPVPDARITSMPAGNDANPGAQSLRMRSQAKVAIGPNTAGGGAAVAPPGARALGPNDAVPGAAPAEPAGALVLSTSGAAKPGETVSVTLQNRSGSALQGELAYDVSVLQSAQGGAGADAGRLRFDLSPRGEQVFLLRALPASANVASTDVTVNGLIAVPADGPTPGVEGSGQIKLGRP